MSIANELSSDIVCALMQSPEKDEARAAATHRTARELTRVIIEAHQTLHRLTVEARHARRRDKAVDAERRANDISSAAANGGH